MIHAYFRNEFKDSYISTGKNISKYQCYVVLDFYEYPLKATSGAEVKLTVCDTSGQEGFQELRKMQYQNATLFLVCYDVIAPASLNNVRKNWAQEITSNAPGCPMILCGNKLDLAESDPKSYIDEKLANQVKADFNFFSSHQCSSLDYVQNEDRQNGRLEELFQSIIECGFKAMKKTKKGPKCIIL